MQVLKNSEANYEKKLEEIKNSEPIDDRLYFSTVTALNNNRYQQSVFKPVLEDLESGYAYHQKTGNSVSLIEPFAYDFLLNRDVQTRQRASFLAIAAIIGALAGIFSSERHTNMEQMISSTYRGRSVGRRIKPVLVAVTSFVSVIALSLIQMININKNIAFPDMDKAIQGIRYMSDFGIYMSIRSYFILMLVIRGLFGVIIGVITAYLSKRGDDKFTVICRTVIVMVIWIFVTAAIPGIEALSPINLLGWRM